jgi:hypothetical protein
MKIAKMAMIVLGCILSASAAFAGTAMVAPSYDLSGSLDYLAIQSAVAGLPSNGGTVILDMGELFYISQTVQLPGGVTLKGSGQVQIISYADGPAILVSGQPALGWGIENLIVNIASSSPNARGIKVIAGQRGLVSNLTVEISNPSQIGIEETTSGGWNSQFNEWDRINIWLGPNAANSTGWSFSSASAAANTCFETVRDLWIVNSLPNQIGIHAGASDTNSFWQFAMSGLSGTAVMFDYENGINSTWPSDYTFFSIDAATSKIVNRGDPSKAATKNKIYGLGRGNGERIPRVANLSVF